MGDRDRLEHWATVAERAGATDGAALAIMSGAVGRDGVAQMAADAARGRALGADGAWLALSRLLTGVAAHLQGDREGARADLEEGCRRGAIAAPLVQVLCLAQLALLALDADDMEGAALLVSRARAQVDRVGIEECPTACLVFAVSALVRAHRASVEDAQEDRRRATALLAGATEGAPWYAIETHVTLARAVLRLGDVAAARGLLDAAARLLRAAPDPGVLKAWIAGVRVQVDAFSAASLSGPASLTTAELRVLRLLPTHLSFREMGEHLHVSGNTIKTHAHAVYRKLDVGCRSEAVGRAQDMGLLDGRP
jgi:LuxR family transcriptional regulator, maltose regulon positive regulatory protein